MQAACTPLADNVVGEGEPCMYLGLGDDCDVGFTCMWALDPGYADACVEL